MAEGKDWGQPSWMMFCPQNYLTPPGPAVYTDWLLCPGAAQTGQTLHCTYHFQVFLFHQLTSLFKQIQTLSALFLLFFVICVRKCCICKIRIRTKCRVKKMHRHVHFPQWHRNTLIPKVQRLMFPWVSQTIIIHLLVIYHLKWHQFFKLFYQTCQI